MLKGRIIRNSAAAIAQVVATGVILVVLYRYLLSTIGVERLGVWSIVLAATSITRLGEAGFSGSVVRYVSKYIAQETSEKIDEVIQTGAICAAAGVGSLLLLVYPFADNILGYLVTEGARQEALSILPYAMMSLWISSVAGAYQSGLDGFQRNDIRNMLLIVGSLLYLFAATMLIPEYGFVGLGYAQVMQSVVMLILNWAFLKRQFAKLSFLPKWHKQQFIQMWNYSVHFQFASIAGMLFDPVSKALLTKFGDLTMVGYYEMANRLVLQIRAMVVSANQVVVPVISGLHESAPERIKPMYRQSFNALLFFSLPVFAIIFSSMPLISELWIGHYVADFVIFTGILLIGWFANSMSAPAFFANQGTGHLGWNSFGQIVIGGINLGLGIALGYLYQGSGVVAAWGIALIAGSLVVIASYHYQHKIPFRTLLPKESVRLVLFSVGGAVLCLVGYYQFRGSLKPLMMSAATFSVFLIVVFPSIWAHPVRRHFWPGVPPQNFGN